MGSSRRRSSWSRIAISRASPHRRPRSRRPYRAAGRTRANRFGGSCQRSGSHAIRARRSGDPCGLSRRSPKRRTARRQASFPRSRVPWPRLERRHSLAPLGRPGPSHRRSRRRSGPRLETADPSSGCSPRIPSASAGRGPSPASSAASPRAWGSRSSCSSRRPSLALTPRFQGNEARTIVLQ